ncbi:hypothetical protein K1T73_05655 [Roseovarius sp. SCSIO 43702]|uniref:hypothetical protein n=1 Tax=Roseovarius sp. SCSIO 43702 TaxID=2823043 RepID=UPI001C72CCBA|nr:hypothetical protein [Roseovarius sp. SCSIO 43702]QYX57873.1 hypothetical protein K1T73_05655 [Roseovarius sp. SCSIO 43702]
MPAEKIGTTIPAPVLYTDEKVTGYENFCEVTQTETLDEGVTRLALRCDAEGEIYEERKFLMVQGDTMWAWSLVEGFDPTMTEFQRCPG